MDIASKIYVAGHRGMVGSAIHRCLLSQGFSNVIARSRGDLDLTKQEDVEAFFDRERPDHVFLAAARVGGILANYNYPAEFFYQNLAIQTNIIAAAHKYGVKQLLFLGSSCVYPRECPQPIKEDYLLSGPLEFTNRPYAVAKIAGIEQCWAFNRQYGTRFLSVMPTNLYGPGDHYDLENSHVLPAILRKMHDAKNLERDSVTMWGTGSPRREFLHVDDMAAAAVYLMSLPDQKYNPLVEDKNQPPLINVGYGKDLTIKELAELLKTVVGFKGQIIWDHSKPDGTPRKLLDISRILSLGWKPSISFEDGVAATYRYFLSEVAPKLGRSAQSQSRTS